MSLFPSEHLSVAITPMAVAVVAYKGRWRPVRHDAHEVRFDADGLDNALAGLAHALGAWTKPGATVRFSISNAFVRTALLPWSGGKLSLEEEAVFARQCLTELYGDMNGWQIQLNCECQYGRPNLAFAMPVRLVEETMSLSRQHGLNCQGITPSAVHSWNRHGVASLAQDLLFSVVESGYALVMATHGVQESRTLVSARMMALSHGARVVEDTLRREVLLQGLEDETQCLCDAYGEIGMAGSVRVVLPRIKESVAITMATDGWVC